MIDLDETTRINTDHGGEQVCIEKWMEASDNRKEKKEGFWRSLYYYSSMETALKSYCRMVLNESKSMDDLFDRIQNLEKKIDKLLEIRFKGG